MKRYDVIVVGSGPAGAAAAYELARAGATTLILEKRALPRYKTCGGGLVGRTIRAIPFDVRSAVEQVCHTLEVNLAEAGAAHQCHRAGGIVFMTMRDRFDALLTDRAVEAGAHLLAAQPARGVSVDAYTARVDTDGGSFSAPIVIGADGATGIVARSCGWAPNPKAIPALEWEVTVPDATMEQWQGRARFDVGYVPHGYAWVFPKHRHLSIGVLTTRRGHTDLTAALQRYLVECDIPTAAPCQRHGYVIPLGPVDRHLTRGRVILVGDAAGMADPLLAEGISGAVRSGQLAARALITSNLDEGRARRLYQRAIRRELLRDHRIASWFARGVYDPSPAALRVIRDRLPSVAEALVDVFSGESSYRSAFLHPRFLPTLQTLRRSSRSHRSSPHPSLRNRSRA